ncbi:MAG: hypothetical protein K8I82_15255, partial [Anaerolineae bacterium]|nr:hypothetical protein [Anaerolineae bacterium]
INVRLTRVEILENNQAERLGVWETAELNLQPAAQFSILPLQAPGFSPGSYVIQWTPVQPDSRLLPTCHHVFALAAN